MKPTQEQAIEWARKSGVELYGLGRDRTKFDYYLEIFAALAYEAGRKDENEACAKEVDRWIGCDSLAAAIRARREQ